MWLLYVLVATVLFGLATFGLKKGYKYLTVADTMLVECFTSTFVVLIYYLFSHESFRPDNFLLAFAFSIPAYVGYFLYLKAYEQSDLTLTSSLTSISPIFVAVFGYVVLKQSISWLGIIIILLIILGVILVSVSFSGLKITIIDSVKIKWGLFGLLGCVLMDSLSSYMSVTSTPITYLMALIPSEIFFLALLVFFKKEKITINLKSGKKLWPTIWGTTFIAVGTIFSFNSYAIGKAAYVSAVLSTSIVISLILGLTLLKEKLRIQQLIGVVIIFVGVILFSLTA